MPQKFANKWLTSAFIFSFVEFGFIKTVLIGLRSVTVAFIAKIGIGSHRWIFVGGHAGDKP